MELYMMFRAFASDLNYIFQRGLVGNREGIKFIIHTNENSGHKRPHLHAKYQGKEIVISLDNNIEVLEGEMKNKDRSSALVWVKDNLAFLQSKWNALTKGIEISESDFHRK